MATGEYLSEAPFKPDTTTAGNELNISGISGATSLRC